MPRAGETIDDRSETHRGAELPRPGAVLVWTQGAPRLQAEPLARGGIVLGRGDESPFALEDERTSRRHTEVTFDGETWTVADLGSRNGTFVDGVEARTPIEKREPRVVRLGETLFLLVDDVRPYAAIREMSPSGIVTGPASRQAARQIEAAATRGQDLLVLGETGTGKELAARAFHAATQRRPELVAVNCASIPEALAERLLFGARRGAFSGANADATGYLAAADGGVLFLDEIGELHIDVQAKLLRFLETREVMPLGATTSRRVDVQICFATHRDLQGGIGEGRIRADFYYRISQPSVRLPPLRQRLEEISWLLAGGLKGPADGPQASASAAPEAEVTLRAKTVEACLLRAWPGNVRELLREVRRGAVNAQLAGSKVVRPEHMLDPQGAASEGALLEERATGVLARSSLPPPMPPRAPVEGMRGTSAVDVTPERVTAAIAQENGNLAAAARVLGLHRQQLYRLMTRFGIARKDS